MGTLCFQFSRCSCNCSLPLLLTSVLRLPSPAHPHSSSQENSSESSLSCVRACNTTTVFEAPFHPQICRTQEEDPRMEISLYDKIQCLYPKAQGIQWKIQGKFEFCRYLHTNFHHFHRDEKESSPSHSHFRELKSSPTLIPEINVNLHRKKSHQKTNVLVS